MNVLDEIKKDKYEKELKYLNKLEKDINKEIEKINDDIVITIDKEAILKSKRLL